MLWYRTVNGKEIAVEDKIEFDERDGMNLFRSVRHHAFHKHCLPCPYRQP